MQSLFSASGKFSREAQVKWNAITAREFYDGDFELEPVENVEFSFEKALCYPAALTRLSANCKSSYRRTWQHIRSNKVGFRVLWFVSRGQLTMSRSQGALVVPAGHMGILDSSVPFRCETCPDDEGMFESFQLTVPAHLFLEHLEGADQLTDVFSLETAEGKLVQRLLSLLVREGDRLSRRAAKPLTESLLVAISDLIGLEDMDIPRRQSLTEKRLADIENYVMLNLSDPDLCYDRVAANCSISPRYLCYVLKANNTSFSELLWKNRLPRARDLLISPATRDYPIHEIAYMSGFKSAAHFSRMFKAAYGCPPRDFRNRSESHDFRASGGESLKQQYLRVA